MTDDFTDYELREYLRQQIALLVARMSVPVIGEVS